MRSTGQLVHGAALNFTAWSYGEQFNLCALADAEAVPNTWPLITAGRAARVRRRPAQPKLFIHPLDQNQLT